MKTEFEYYIPHENIRNRERIKYLLRNLENYKTFRNSALYGYFYKTLKQVPEKFLTLFDRVEINKDTLGSSSYVTVNLYGINEMTLSFGITKDSEHTQIEFDDANDERQRGLYCYLKYFFQRIKIN